jgi:hypothetical protein
VSGGISDETPEDREDIIPLPSSCAPSVLRRASSESIIHLTSHERALRSCFFLTLVINNYAQERNPEIRSSDSDKSPCSNIDGTRCIKLRKMNDNVKAEPEKKKRQPITVASS